MSILDFVSEPGPDELPDVADDPREALRLATVELRTWRGRVPSAGTPRRYHDVLLFPVRTERAEHIVVVRRDATDEVVARRALTRSERTIALGQVARALGHELNNPLEVARLNLEALSERATDDETRALVDEAREAVGRVAARVADLRSLSTSGARATSASVARALSVARRSLPGRAALRVRGEVDPHLRVRADRPALIRAISHLLENALEASEDAVVLVRARPAGDRIAIEVQDRGPGLPDAARGRAFEPFFTTKEPAGHVGLGLTFAQETARRLDGQLTLDSTPGGLTATLTLAAAEAEPRSGAGARVLLIEDEAPLRRSYARWLRPRCEVVGVGDGDEALELLRAEPFDVVICDVVLPGRDGVELFDIACAERGLCDRWIFVTGGVPSGSVARAVEETGRPVLGKPVDREALLRAVDAVIDAATCAA
jgi:signal transduction histidine kinase